jgi:hypothetical protein
VFSHLTLGEVFSNHGPPISAFLSKILNVEVNCRYKDTLTGLYACSTTIYCRAVDKVGFDS